MPALTTKKKTKAKKAPKKRRAKKPAKVKRAKPRKKSRPKKIKRLPTKEIFKEKPFTEGIRKKEEVGAGILLLPIIFFVLTIATFAYSVYMPANENASYMPAIGFICFILFIITFIYSMIKLNRAA